MVDVTWRVRVPPATPPDDLIFIAGDNGSVFGASYNPGLQPLTPVGDNLWEWSATVQEGTPLLYKYTRGSWRQSSSGAASPAWRTASWKLWPGRTVRCWWTTPPPTGA